MKTEVRFPVPPVCTAAWSDEDWQRWITANGETIEVNPQGSTEPPTMECCGEIWDRTTNLNSKGEALYRRRET